VSRWAGIARRVALGGGAWVLETRGGERYELALGEAAPPPEGVEIEVEGSLDEAAFSLAMVGPVLRVQRWRPG